MARLRATATPAMIDTRRRGEGRRPCGRGRRREGRGFDERQRGAGPDYARSGPMQLRPIGPDQAPRRDQRSAADAARV